MLNNNEANATQGALGTASQLLINPLTDPRGTRKTVYTYLDGVDFVSRKVGDNIIISRNGWRNLDKSFVNIVALSNGGSINVSGIRIEYVTEDEMF
jgi:hypothetical protein